MAQAARDLDLHVLDLHANVLRKWVREQSADPQQAFPGHGQMKPEQVEIERKLVETVVRRCMTERLVGGDGFAVDASLIRAGDNRQRSAEDADNVECQVLAASRRSVREYLDTLDEAVWGAESPTTPKFVSRSDPVAQRTGAHKGHAFFACATNYLIDLDHAVILDATRAIRQAEAGAALTIIERTEDRFGLYPERLAADSAYGSSDMLG